MPRRYVTADVFTDRPFGGNPLAVVLDAHGLDDAAMQAIATEFNYAETTFLLPPRDPAHTARVRIFTPTAELRFAGHPNVGTAFVLARDLLARGSAVPDAFTFEEAAGLVPVRLLREGGDGGGGEAAVGAELTAPEPLSLGAPVAPEHVAACLGLLPADVLTHAHPPRAASVGLSFLVVELASRTALARIRPDAARSKALLPPDGGRGFYAYTRDVGVDGAAMGLDLQARMHSVVRGMVEDPATGSATAAAAALLASLGGGELSLRVGQGFDMGRPSLLLARVAGGVAPSVHVGGRCVAVMEGLLHQPQG